MNRTVLIFALFFSGCSLDFGSVEAGYRGTFDYKTQFEYSYTTTAFIEDDLVTISRDDNGTSSPSSVFRLGSFHVSAGISQQNTADGARTYVLFNGTERIGYFNEGEKDIFYIDEARENYFIRRGSNAVVKPPESEEDPLYY
ncbi:MAG: hypothetical protein LBK05_07105 [Treponema sp.]|nr:hypothetical protein [Treponema sp.]